MKIIFLGAAAGGGFPQWNCRCDVCRLAWLGDERVVPRTQSSIAVSGDGESWLLVNASPDLRQQIMDNRALHPREGKRHSPIEAVVLTNADVDHCAGLLNLRERQALTLYATQETHSLLSKNSIFDVLHPEAVERRVLPVGEPFVPLTGLEMAAFAVPGKVPLYAETQDMIIGGETESVIGLEFRSNGKRAVFMPNCAAVTPSVTARAEGADLLFFDGTTFTDDEMPAAGLSPKTARRMGHVPMSGAEGSLVKLAGVGARRRVFTHINNTNPALVAGSQARQEVEAAGWELAEDGMEIKL